MKIVPEEKKLPELYAPNNPIIREIMGHNACRTEVLNNLKSKEMVDKIKECIKNNIGCEDDYYDFDNGGLTDLNEAALAIQKALIQ